MKNSFVAIENIDDQPAPFQIIKEKTFLGRYDGTVWRRWLDPNLPATIQFTLANP